jgi:hypothetical protein
MRCGGAKGAAEKSTADNRQSNLLKCIVQDQPAPGCKESEHAVQMAGSPSFRKPARIWLSHLAAKHSWIPPFSIGKVSANPESNVTPIMKHIAALLALMPRP